MAGLRPLPASRTRFVGRRAELDDLAALVDRDRLVTVVGPGGCGKTRLALELVRPRAAVVLVELAAVRNRVGVATAILDALGQRDDPHRDPVEQIGDALGDLGPTDGPMILVVDNAEHVLDAVTDLIDVVLARLPELRVVVTSREPLGVVGEAIYRVPPMGIPVDAGSAADRRTSDAVELFVDRAALARPGLVLDDAALAAVGEICRRLDGLPLGIELAASRVELLAPERILDGLQDRFRLLVSGNRAALARHRTLEASVAWSYSLLGADERHLLDHLSAFRGSFDEGAVRVVARGVVDADRATELLHRLAAKSLVVVEPLADTTRYRLLETIADYASNALAERGEIDDAIDRVVEHVVTRTAPWDGDLPGREHVLRLRQLGDDEGNVRVALDRLTTRAASGDGEAADRLWITIGRLTFFWLSAGRFREARARFAAAETMSATDPRLELAARWGACHLATYSGDFDVAIAGATTTHALAVALGDDRYAGRSLDTLGSISCYLDPVSAIATLEQSIELAARCDDRWGLTDARQVLAFTHLMRHDHAAALAELDAAKPVAVELDHPLLLAWDAIGRGTVAVASGRRLEAATAIEASRQQVARTDDPNLAALLLGLEATLALLDGYGGRWADHLHDARRRGERTEAGLSLPVVIIDLLLVLLDDGDCEAAQTVVDHDVDTIAAFAPAFAARVHGIASAVALRRGDLTEASRRGDAARVAFETMANPSGRAVVAPVLALVHLGLGDAGAAEAEVSAALDRLVALDLRPTIVDAVEVLALSVAARGDTATAQWLAAVARHERERLGLVHTELWCLTAPALHELATTTDSVQPTNGTVPTERRPAEASIEEALAFVRRSRGKRRRPSIGWASLTPTELRVIGFVAAGCTNAQAAERLFISPATVKSHLAHIFRKLDITNRAALVTAFTKATMATATDPGELG